MRSIGEGLEATFVAGEHGGGALALWGTDVAPTGDDLPLALPGDDGVRVVAVPVERVPVAHVVDHLAALPVDHGGTASVQAWGVATKFALDLIGRGRVLPGVAADGTDQWVLGPLDAEDQARLDQLVDALPAAAHALAVDDEGPVQIAAPRPVVTAFLDTVTDAFVRTAAAPLAAGHRAFAASTPTDVGPWRDWLGSTTSATGRAAAPSLRVVLPVEADDPVECVLELHSRIDPGLAIAAADLWTAPAAVVARFGRDVDLELLVTLRRAARAWAPISRLLDDARPDRLQLDDDEADALFGPVVEDLAAAGLTVMWPREVLRTIEVRPVVATEQPEAIAGSGLDLATLSVLRWRASVDGDELTDDELDALAQAKRPMVRMRGRWVRADPEQLRRLRERTPVRASDALAAALSGQLVIDGQPVDADIEGPLVDLAERLRSLDTTARWTPPSGLAAELRPYQQRGVAWLTELTGLGLGGVLADDMGLGKTVQVLSLHLARRGSGPTLIVCPASLLGNWEREAARFAPDVTVRRLHGADRSLTDITDDELVVTTYGVVRRDAADLAQVPWGLVVTDEAQAIKNPFSRTAKALRSIPSAARVALTGTPVENRLADLWALLDWATPGLLGPLEVFQRSVAVPIERDHDDAVAAQLADTVRPFVLRRRKTDPDIVPELPPKTETDRFVTLTSEQATLYRAVLDELLEEVAEAEGIDRRGLVLKLLTALKQVCNHPAQYLGSSDDALGGRSGKLDLVSDLVPVIVDEGDSVIIFTQYVAMGHLLTRHLETLGIASRFLHGSVPVNQRQQMVDDFQAGSPQVLVVSLKAGGTGLNLTRATHVVHYDRWWNPAVEDQASDRAWRIGQDRPVQVHRLICEGTLEERIAVVLDTKRTLAESVVGGGEAWLSELSDDQLAALVELGGA
ncbi:MAG: DEAD/DEAH box helicase [Acidimicrobiales bacterium]